MEKYLLVSRKRLPDGSSKYEPPLYKQDGVFLSLPLFLLFVFVGGCGRYCFSSIVAPITSSGSSTPMVKIATLGKRLGPPPQRVANGQNLRIGD